MEESKEKNKSQKWTAQAVLKEATEWVICFIVAYIIYLIINFFFGTISCVKQTSMFPTAKEGDRVTIQRSKVFKKQLKYEDIIIFESPIDRVIGKKHNENETADFIEKKGFSAFTYYFLGFGKSEYIKRVIGLPGDHIKITENGEVYRNDEKLEETYLTERYTPINGEYTDVVVPENCIYVMGDNRSYSKDSRYFGCIPIEKVTGYVGIRVWPLNRLGKI